MRGMQVLWVLVVGSLSLLILLASNGCSNDDSSESSCPPGSHLVNGVCIPADGDSTQEAEESLADSELTEEVESNTDTLPEEDSVDVDTDELEDLDCEQEPKQEHVELPVYEFPEPRVLFDETPVKEAKLAADGEVLLIAARFNDAVLPYVYDLLALPASGGDAVFLGNVSWDPDFFSWLSFELTPDRTHVLFANNLNRVYNILMSDLTGEPPLLIADVCYPGHFAVSSDSTMIAFGRGTPQQNRGMLAALYVKQLDMTAPEKQIATSVVPNSFRFLPGTHTLVYGQGESPQQFNIVLTTPDLTVNEVVVEDVGHPFFKLVTEPLGLLYYTRRGFEYRYFALMYKTIEDRLSTLLYILEWGNHGFDENDIQIGAGNTVVFAEPYGLYWRYSTVELDGSQPVPLLEDTPRTGVLNPTGTTLFVYGKSETNELWCADLITKTAHKIGTDLLTGKVFFDESGQYAFFAVKLPEPYPQAGQNVILAYDTYTDKLYAIADNTNGEVIVPDCAHGKLYYTNSDGFLVEVELSFQREFLLP